MPPATDPALSRFLRDELGVGEMDGVAAQEWRFTGPVWVWRGNGSGPPPKAAWYFITIDGETAAAIRAATRGTTGGFGSIRVSVTIGDTAWQTSLFPSKDSGGYLLPLKAGVRKATGIVENSVIAIRIMLS